MDKQVKPNANNNKMLVQSGDDELFIYNLESNQAFCLNPTSAAVWQLCDDKTDFAKIMI